MPGEPGGGEATKASGSPVTLPNPWVFKLFSHFLQKKQKPYVPELRGGSAHL